MENEQQKNVRKLAQVYDMSTKMVHAILLKHLKLFKKSARWLPNQMDKEMKKE
jgi:hypothetical protein